MNVNILKKSRKLDDLDNKNNAIEITGFTADEILKQDDRMLKMMDDSKSENYIKEKGLKNAINETTNN